MGTNESLVAIGTTRRNSAIVQDASGTASGPGGIVGYSPRKTVGELRYRIGTRRDKASIHIDTHTALEHARPAVFWTDTSDQPDPAPTLSGARSADLVVVGAGFSGLWAALQAVLDAPGRRVIVLEARVTGFGASSRNGGFLEASLTHGTANGLGHWPDEMETLERMGSENFAAIVAMIADYNLDADIEVTGATAVATQPWHIDEIDEAYSVGQRFGERQQLLDRTAMRGRLDSPTYLGGLFSPDGTAIVNPAKLAWELRRLAETYGVEFHDNSPVTGIERDGSLLKVTAGDGSVTCQKVLVATNAYRGPVRQMRRYMVPVYDYVLMTEPLSVSQMASIGWDGREGVSDVSNQFHYYRLTADNRILWGGYDAVYRFRNAVGEEYDQAGDTHELLAEHFHDTFPQLEDLSFSHRWGGPIATTSQFTATWGTSHNGDLSWVGGYTGLGVAATRFGGRVALDLVDGRDSEYTALSMVSDKPMAFPPEPFRYTGIQLTRRAIARSDSRGGRRGLWLKTLDKFGVGFDS